MKEGETGMWAASENDSLPPDGQLQLIPDRKQDDVKIIGWNNYKNLKNLIDFKFQPFKFSIYP